MFSYSHHFEIRPSAILPTKHATYHVEFIGIDPSSSFSNTAELKQNIFQRFNPLSSSSTNGQTHTKQFVGYCRQIV